MIGSLTVLLLVSAAPERTPLTLEEVRAAGRMNLDALKAEIEVAKAAEGRRSARASILPQVSLSAGVGFFLQGPQRVFSTVPNASGGFDQRSVDVDGNTRGNFQLGLSVNQLIYDGGKWWNAIAQAGQAEAATLGQLDEQRLTSELEAVRRFFELVRAQTSLKVLNASVERSRQLFERSKALFEAGRGQRRDVFDAEVNLGNDRISVLRQQQAIISAQIDLLNWLGRPVTPIVAVDPPGLDPTQKAEPGPEVAQAIAAAREKRPLLKVLAAQDRSAELSEDIARSGYLPRVSANIGLSRSAPTADPFFTDPTKQNSLSMGLSLQWDIFSGFATDAAVSRAHLDARSVSLGRLQAERDLSGELTRSLGTLAAQIEVATIAAENAVLSLQALKLAEERYNAGAGSTLEVRDAQIKFTQAQLQQSQGRVDVEISRAVVQRLMGGGS